MTLKALLRLHNILFTERWHGVFFHSTRHLLDQIKMLSFSILFHYNSILFYSMFGKLSDKGNLVSHIVCKIDNLSISIIVRMINENKEIKRQGIEKQ